MSKLEAWIKAFFYFQISAPSEVTVVMSAVKADGDPQPDPEIPGNNLHKFVQKIPIQVNTFHGLSPVYYLYYLYLVVVDAFTLKVNASTTTR